MSCNDQGRIAFWHLDTFLSKAYWEDARYRQAASQGKEHRPGPSFSFQAHDEGTPIYQLCFLGSNVLISAGEKEIRGWDWGKLLAKAESSSQSSSSGMDIEGEEDNVDEALLYNFRNQEYPTETNGVAVTKEGLIYAACGDNKVHIWDTETEQEVGSLQGHADYVHCVAVTNDGNQVISGGEDGTVRLWDARTREPRAVLDAAARKSVSVTDFKPKLGGNNWVSCVALDEYDTWMVCGGGTHFLSLWHLPSLTSSTVMPTGGTPQAALFNDNEIVSVGNESKVYHWGKTNGILRSTAESKSSSLFSVAYNKEPVHLQVLAVSGNSPNVDIYTSLGNRSFSFKFQ